MEGSRADWCPGGKFSRKFHFLSPEKLPDWLLCPLIVRSRKFGRLLNIKPRPTTPVRQSRHQQRYLSPFNFLPLVRGWILSKAAYLKTNGKLMRCYIILEICYEGSVLVISAFCALVESGLDIKMIICIHESRQTSSERGTLVGIEDKMPSTLSSKYLDYFFMEHYNRQHCRLNICRYID